MHSSYAGRWKYRLPTFSPAEWRFQIRRGRLDLVDQRANLDYGRDDNTRDFMIIDDDGVLVTESVYDVTDGVDDDVLHERPADSDDFDVAR
jgi:hypothetical protein